MHWSPATLSRNTDATRGRMQAGQVLEPHYFMLPRSI